MEFVKFYSVKYSNLLALVVVSLHLCLERFHSMEIK